MFIPYVLENVFTPNTKSVACGTLRPCLVFFYIEKLPTVIGGTGGFINIVHSQT